MRAFTSLAVLGSFLGAAIASEESDLELVLNRRKVDLAQFPDNSWFAEIPGWLQSQKSDGTWSDVSYLSGCPARTHILPKPSPMT